MLWVKGFPFTLLLLCNAGFGMFLATLPLFKFETLHAVFAPQSEWVSLVNWLATSDSHPSLYLIALCSTIKLKALCFSLSTMLCFFFLWGSVSVKGVFLQCPLGELPRSHRFRDYYWALGHSVNFPLFPVQSLYLGQGNSGTTRIYWWAYSCQQEECNIAHFRKVNQLHKVHHLFNKSLYLLSTNYGLALHWVIYKHHFIKLSLQFYEVGTFIIPQHTNDITKI